MVRGEQAATRVTPVGEPRPLRPHDLAWLERAPLVVRVERALEAPASAVWARIADHATWPMWFPEVDSVEPGATAEGVGGTRRVRVGRVVFDEEFVAWDPPRCFAFTVTAMRPRLLRSLVECVEVEPLGEDSCRVTYRQGFDAGPAVRVLLGLSRRRLERTLAGALDSLGRAATPA